MRWLALWLPELPLIAHPGRPLPSAVVERGRLVACDETAVAAGLQPGMRAATARGMLPDLALLPRDTDAEAACLAELACWAGQYTPDVIVEAPAALLLEVGGCLRLFGGIDALLARIDEGCRQRDLAPQLAVAPTPQAALWLAQRFPAPAKEARPPVVPTHEALPAALTPLPAQLLAASETQARQLDAFGLKTLGEALQLPMPALARRLGSDCVARLEQALGDRPDLRPRFVFPERFEQTLVLPGPAHEAPMLAFAAGRLLDTLCGWLNARQSGLVAGTLTLRHEALPGRPRESTIELALATPTRSRERIVRVLRERLERSELPAPVIALTLTADRCEDLAGRSRALFDAGHEAEGIETLVDQLRARLGDDAVHGLVPTADHRPERATRRAPVGALPPPTPTGTPVRLASPQTALTTRVPHVSSPNQTNGASATRALSPPTHDRPLLMLPEPQALPEIDGRPQHRRAPLELVAGPERIESGWWDGGEGDGVGDVRRDYFVARNPDNEYLWIFRTANGWHLHGVFA